MEVGLVRKIDIDHEMQQSYLDYAMSVIVARALPDARDGLKPVHRRILYAMYDMGLRPNTPYKKSARIVGEVLGKYHPHGDMAVYDAMARMAQLFSMRYPLVDGQGNFGSIDGDSQAAMRYTEARMAQLASYMLEDIDKDTVDFVQNFDETLKEPDVLPAAFPNLLVNGITGIAVGMSTSIPPHHLGEVVDAIIYMLENWNKLDDISVDDLMKFIQGPDFPSGGIIVETTDSGSLKEAYGRGRGRIKVRAKAHVEEMSRGRHRLIVTELPYMVNKSTLIERIATLARDGNLEGLVDLRDESDRQGMRIVIELAKSADQDEILSTLYRRTQMESTFSIIMLALVEGEPRMISLKQALRVYVEHRLEIIRRRSEHDLAKAKHRAHVLEGYRVALDNLDEVIAMIRKSRTVISARNNLMRGFSLSEIQAQAILDMPLRRLAAMERKKIDDEYKEVRGVIKSLEGLLRSPKKIRMVVADELIAVKEKHNDLRRTQIFRLDASRKDLPTRLVDLAPEEDTWVAIDSDGKISRSIDDKRPRISGYEAPKWLVNAKTTDTLYLVTKKGEAASIPVHAVPQADKPSEGVPYSRICPLNSQDKLGAILTLPPESALPEEGYVVTVTQQGMVKKSDVHELPGPAAAKFTFVRVNEGDELRWINITDGKQEIILVTSHGMMIRFSEEDVRPMGLVAAGVMGIKLKGDDILVGTAIVPGKGELFILASNGHAKRIKLNDIPSQGRYGQGVVAWKLPADRKLVSCAFGKGTLRTTIHLDKYAPKSCRLDDAPVRKRSTTRGGEVVEVREGDRILSMNVPLDFDDIRQ